MIKFKSIKTQLILFLICFAIFLSLKNKDGAFLFAIAIAVISALVIESVILYFKTKTLQITESSIITGLIVGYVLSSDEAWWRFALASLLAILSKYLIRLQKKHIFNPAAFGIFLTLIIFGVSTQWQGTYIWYILLPFGFYFGHKIRKIEILIGYAVVALASFGIQAMLQKAALWHIFGYLSYFFIFIMLIEPLTSPIKPMGKFIFGACVAGVIFVLSELGAKFDVELFSLLAMNFTVSLFNKLLPKKGA
ncbi:MAG: RnfABCDGE type electron transport complex subunit D [Candidatus Omnitrophota bacterium]